MVAITSGRPIRLKPKPYPISSSSSEGYMPFTNPLPLDRRVLGHGPHTEV